MKYTVIELDLYLMVHSIVFKFEKIWLSGTLKLLSGNQKCDGRTNGHEDPYTPPTRRAGVLEIKKITYFHSSYRKTLFRQVFNVEQ